MSEIEIVSTERLVDAPGFRVNEVVILGGDGETVHIEYSEADPHG